MKYWQQLLCKTDTQNFRPALDNILAEIGILDLQNADVYIDISFPQIQRVMDLFQLASALKLDRPAQMTSVIWMKLR